MVKKKCVKFLMVVEKWVAYAVQAAAQGRQCLQPGRLKLDARLEGEQMDAFRRIPACSLLRDWVSRNYWLSSQFSVKLTPS